MERFFLITKGNEEIILKIFSLFLSVLSIINFADKKITWPIRLCFLILVLLLITFIVVLYSNLKSKVDIKLDNGKKITISWGSIFDPKGTIIIPVNSSFDINVDNKIVSADSLHGKFIKKYFNNNAEELYSKIIKDLDEEKISFSQLKNNKRKYSLGDVARISVGENTFLLLALTDFDEKNIANCSSYNYGTIICNLLAYINGYCKDKKVYMPLIGGGLARLNKSPQKLLEYLLSILIFNDDLLPDKLDIIISPKYKGEIILEKVRKI